VPTPVFERSTKRYPDAALPLGRGARRAAGLADDQPDLEAVQVTYVNPETGEDAENILGFYALMLRPGQTLRLPARSPGQVFHLIEGRVQAQIVDSTFTLAEADTCCAPGYEAGHADQPRRRQALFRLHCRRIAAAPQAGRLRNTLTP
jgi:gentisate 1,2-dioxygenase